MKNRIKSLLLSLTALFAFIAPSVVTLTAHAQVDIADSINCGANVMVPAGTPCPTNPGEAEDNVVKLVTNIINIFSWIVGVVAVIMIMFGGFQYITAGGNDQNVGKAKNTILFAVIGLVVVALAQIVVRFVVSKASNITD